MRVTVRLTSSFKKAAKPPYLRNIPLDRSNDLMSLEKELTGNPRLGTSLGNNSYKIRLKISTKGKGKSSGARIISLIETTLIGEIEILNEEVTVNLLTIYDKSEISTITDRELKDLIRAFHQS